MTSQLTQCVRLTLGGCVPTDHLRIRPMEPAALYGQQAFVCGRLEQRVSEIDDFPPADATALEDFAIEQVVQSGDEALVAELGHSTELLLGRFRSPHCGSRDNQSGVSGERAKPRFEDRLQRSGEVARAEPAREQLLGVERITFGPGKTSLTRSVPP